MHFESLGQVPSRTKGVLNGLSFKVATMVLIGRFWTATMMVMQTLALQIGVHPFAITNLKIPVIINTIGSMLLAI